MDDIDILVPLLDEGVDVWRPVRASQLGGDLFLIRRASIPEIEHWMFTPGEVVRCVERVRADGKIDAVAIEALPEVPDTVKTWVDGRAIDASGKGVAITLEGDPDFVESLPAEFDPGRDDPA